MITWRDGFVSYRKPTTEEVIVNWLSQFRAADKDVAARLLDAVEFVPAERIHHAYRSLLADLPGWALDESQRVGRFAFVAFSSSAGESGDNMLHQFRLANDLTKARYNNLFIGRSDLARSGLGAGDTVVFIDDFVGTGRQAVAAWENMFQELTASISNVYLVAIGAFQPGSNLVAERTRMRLVTHRSLTQGDNLFSEECRHFTAAEKASLLRYCKVASKSAPKGFGECGLAFVLYHQCPNNCLSVLHSRSQKWAPLFPRTTAIA